MIYLKNKETNEIKTFEVDNYLQLSKNIRDQFDEATQVEIDEFNLNEAKNNKIAELEAFHESDEARILTINDTFQISTKYEQTRKWFNEIVHDLENKIKITGQSPDEITFQWQIQHKTWLPIKLSDLQLVKCKIFDITSVNYQQKISHLEAIEELNTIEKIESYDFKKGYLLNNKLNFDI
jgi:hypothetical protein